MQNGVSVWRSARPRAWQILVSGLLGLAGLTLVPAPAQAVLRTCDQAGLTAALLGGTNTFDCSGPTTITVSSTQTVSVSGTVLDGGGLLTISGNDLNRVFTVNASVTATFQNMTITGGSAGSGGGIYNDGMLTISNSIVANSSSGGHCGGLSITDGGNNLDSANTCGFTVNAFTTTNPNLGALTGSPAYFPLTTGSPAIDAANNTICANAPVNNESQNGVTRPIDGDTNGTAICDIGSYEAPAGAGIPTLSEWAQIGMAALLVGGGLFALRRRSSPTLQS